jgi:hypothetical protein
MDSPLVCLMTTTWKHWRYVPRDVQLCLCVSGNPGASGHVTHWKSSACCRHSSSVACSRAVDGSCSQAYPSGLDQRLSVLVEGRSLSMIHQWPFIQRLAHDSLANWSFIMDTIGLTPSALGAMTSSTSARRSSVVAVTSAFSQTLDANLCRAILSIWPRSLLIT